MDWPSDRVAQGGIFHNHKVNYSKETQDLIRLLMEESKLTMLQRKQINYHLRNGDPLPLPRENKPKTASQSAPQYYRAKSIRKRTLSSIMASNVYDMERYIPRDAFKEPSEKAKLKLQERMSGVKHDPDSMKLKIGARYKHRERNDGEQDRIEELLGEIKERMEWLDEMESLGEAKKHRPVIQAQIREKLEEIRHIEQERSRGIKN